MEPNCTLIIFIIMKNLLWLITLTNTCKYLGHSLRNLLCPLLSQFQYKIMNGSCLQYYWHVQSMAKLLISTWVAVIMSTFMSLIYITHKILLSSLTNVKWKPEMHLATNIYVPRIYYVSTYSFQNWKTIYQETRKCAEITTQQAWTNTVLHALPDGNQ